MSHELPSYLNNLGLMILGNEFYLAVLKDCLLDFSLIQWFLNSWIWTRNSWVWTSNSWIWNRNSWIWTRKSWIWTRNSWIWTRKSWIWTRKSWIWTRKSWIWTCNLWIWTRNSWIWTSNSWTRTRTFEFQLVLLSSQLVTRNSCLAILTITFEAQFTKTLSNTETELKKSVAY